MALNLDVLQGLAGSQQVRPLDYNQLSRRPEGSLSPAEYDRQSLASEQRSDDRSGMMGSFSDMFSNIFAGTSSFFADQRQQPQPDSNIFDMFSSPQRNQPTRGTGIQPQQQDSPFRSNFTLGNMSLPLTSVGEVLNRTGYTGVGSGMSTAGDTLATGQLMQNVIMGQTNQQDLQRLLQSGRLMGRGARSIYNTPFSVNVNDTPWRWNPNTGMFTNINLPTESRTVFDLARDYFRGQQPQQGNVQSGMRFIEGEPGDQSGLGGNMIRAIENLNVGDRSGASTATQTSLPTTGIPRDSMQRLQDQQFRPTGSDSATQHLQPLTQQAGDLVSPETTSLQTPSVTPGQVIENAAPGFTMPNISNIRASDLEIPSGQLQRIPGTQAGRSAMGVTERARDGSSIKDFLPRIPQNRLDDVRNFLNRRMKDFARKKEVQRAGQSLTGDIMRSTEQQLIGVGPGGQTSVVRSGMGLGGSQSDRTLSPFTTNIPDIQQSTPAPASALQRASRELNKLRGDPLDYMRSAGGKLVRSPRAWEIGLDMFDRGGYATDANLGIFGNLSQLLSGDDMSGQLLRQSQQNIENEHYNTVLGRMANAIRRDPTQTRLATEGIASVVNYLSGNPFAYAPAIESVANYGEDKLRRAGYGRTASLLGALGFGASALSQATDPFRGILTKHGPTVLYGGLKGLDSLAGLFSSPQQEPSETLREIGEDDLWTESALRGLSQAITDETQPLSIEDQIRDQEIELDQAFRQDREDTTLRGQMSRLARIDGTTPEEDQAQQQRQSMRQRRIQWRQQLRDLKQEASGYEPVETEQAQASISNERDRQLIDRIKDNAQEVGILSAVRSRVRTVNQRGMEDTVSRMEELRNLVQEARDRGLGAFFDFDEAEREERFASERDRLSRIEPSDAMGRPSRQERLGRYQTLQQELSRLGGIDTDMNQETIDRMRQQQREQLRSQQVQFGQEAKQRLDRQIRGEAQQLRNDVSRFIPEMPDRFSLMATGESEQLRNARNLALRAKDFIDIELSKEDPSNINMDQIKQLLIDLRENKRRLPVFLQQHYFNQTQ